MRRLGDGSAYLLNSAFRNPNLMENRAIKMNLANEGLEKAREEEEKNVKKRKADADKLWEGPSYLLRLPSLADPLNNIETREERVGSWRNFASSKKKKSKKSNNILG